jgi:hypothetical protein
VRAATGTGPRQKRRSAYRSTWTPRASPTRGHAVPDEPGPSRCSRLAVVTFPPCRATDSPCARLDHSTPGPGGGGGHLASDHDPRSLADPGSRSSETRPSRSPDKRQQFENMIEQTLEACPPLPPHADRYLGAAIDELRAAAESIAESAGTTPNELLSALARELPGADDVSGAHVVAARVADDEAAAEIDAGLAGAGLEITTPTAHRYTSTAPAPPGHPGRRPAVPRARRARQAHGSPRRTPGRRPPPGAG